MRIESSIEASIQRHARLVEKLYYRPTARVRDLVEELGVDRNTLLSDIETLSSLFKDEVAEYTRGSGTVTLRFADGCILISLVQRIYSTSLFLRLLVSYLDGEVDIRRFAGEAGVSLSRAYAINRRAAECLSGLGIDIKDHALSCDEWRLRFLSQTVRTMTGAVTPTMTAYSHELEAGVAQIERRTGHRYHGISRPLLKTALGLALDRSSKPLAESTLALLETVPLLDFFRTGFTLAGRPLTDQEARFIAFDLACIDADYACAGDGSSWLDGLPGFKELSALMREAFGETVVDTRLFRTALRGAFIYLRFNISEFALIQHRPLSPEVHKLMDRSLEIVRGWSKGENGADMPAPDLVKLFSYQISPLFSDSSLLEPFGYAIVTSSEVNRLHFEELMSRLFGAQAVRIETPVGSMGGALEACRAWKDLHGRRAVAIFDREYPENARSVGSLTPDQGGRPAHDFTAAHETVRISVMSPTQAVRDAVLACLQRPDRPARASERCP